jgi:hypothetical protein
MSLAQTAQIVTGAASVVHTTKQKCRKVSLVDDNRAYPTSLSDRRVVPYLSRLTLALGQTNRLLQVVARQAVDDQPMAVLIGQI